MRGALLRNVTIEERRQFQRDGVIFLHAIIAPEWIDDGAGGHRGPAPFADTLCDRNIWRF